MEVTVSKESINKLEQSIVDEIIAKAKTNASDGIVRFFHELPLGKGLSFNSIANKVKELTNDTVFAGYRSITNEGINFSIKTI